MLGLELTVSSVAGATKNRNPMSPADILSLSFRIRTVVKRTVTVCVIVVNSPAYASILVPFASRRMIAKWYFVPCARLFIGAVEYSVENPRSPMGRTGSSVPPGIPFSSSG